MTSDQAFQLFVYADWAMVTIASVSLAASLGLAVFSALPINKGRRRPLLVRALVCLAAFVVYFVMQASVMVAWFYQEWTALRIALFGLPAVALLCGIFATVYYGAGAAFRQSGKRRIRSALRSLLPILLLGVGLAPHAITILMPILATKDHVDRPGSLAHIGDPAPDFELTTVDGDAFRTADLRGKVVVLNFFATWCGPCEVEMPHLQAVWSEFQGDDFRMLVIGRKETDDDVRSYLKERDLSFPAAADPDGAIYGLFASQSIPRTYLISRDGVILHEWTGAYEQEITQLKKRLKAELK